TSRMSTNSSVVAGEQACINWLIGILLSLWSCSKLHEYAGSRNCQHMVSNFERQPPSALMHRWGIAAKSIWLSRHICHASLTLGTEQVSAGAAVITPQRRS